jgi:hypothetical protein
MGLWATPEMTLRQQPASIQYGGRRSRMDAAGGRTSATVCIRHAKRRSRAVAAVVLGLMVQGACAQTVRADLPLHWVPFLHVAGVVDLSGPRRDGSLTVTAGGHLFLLQPSGTLRARTRRVRHGPWGGSVSDARTPAAGARCRPRGDPYVPRAKRRPAETGSSKRSLRKRRVEKNRTPRLSTSPERGFHPGLSVEWHLLGAEKRGSHATAGAMSVWAKSSPL